MNHNLSLTQNRVITSLTQNRVQLSNQVSRQVTHSPTHPPTPPPLATVLHRRYTIKLLWSRLISIGSHSLPPLQLGDALAAAPVTRDTALPGRLYCHSHPVASAKPSHHHRTSHRLHHRQPALSWRMLLRLGPPSTHNGRWNSSRCPPQKTSKQRWFTAISSRETIESDRSSQHSKVSDSDHGLTMQNIDTSAKFWARYLISIDEKWTHFSCLIEESSILIFLHDFP